MVEIYFFISWVLPLFTPPSCFISGFLVNKTLGQYETGEPLADAKGGNWRVTPADGCHYS